MFQADKLLRGKLSVEKQFSLIDTTTDLAEAMKGAFWVQVGRKRMADVAHLLSDKRRAFDINIRCALYVIYVHPHPLERPLKSRVSPQGPLDLSKHF